MHLAEIRKSDFLGPKLGIITIPFKGGENETRLTCSEGSCVPDPCSKHRPSCRFCMCVTGYQRGTFLYTDLAACEKANRRMICQYAYPYYLIECEIIIRDS